MPEREIWLLTAAITFLVSALLFAWLWRVADRNSEANFHAYREAERKGDAAESTLLRLAVAVMRGKDRRAAEIIADGIVRDAEQRVFGEGRR